MKIQRKLLTEKQRQQICEKHSEIGYEDGKRYCKLDCPLRSHISDGVDGVMDCSCKRINVIESSINNYWNEEIEIEVSE